MADLLDGLEEHWNEIDGPRSGLSEGKVRTRLAELTARAEKAEANAERLRAAIEKHKAWELFEKPWRDGSRSYQCVCSDCGSGFIGFKHETTCSTCRTERPQSFQNEDLWKALTDTESQGGPLGWTPPLI